MSWKTAWRGPIVAVALTALAQGCAKAPVPVVSTARIYAVDQQGAAQNCKVSDVAAQQGHQVPVQMTVGNDGGWCALTISAAGSPYGAGLLIERAEHGTVYIHSVGDATRIDYTPARGYTGPDRFTTTLVPGEVTLAFAVTVTK